MADSDPKNSEKINGFKYRSHMKPDGYWTDPFEEQVFYSRTFMPLGTLFVEAQEEEEMKEKIKKEKDVKFKEEDLSEDTKDKFKEDKDLDDKVEKKEK